MTRHPAVGRLSLVGAGPGAADLLTLRALNRLQQADVVFYDRLVDPEVVAMANPQAERIYVGKSLGTPDWPQDRINAVIVSAALQGQRVVRLKSGDPSVFGRATEELNAAQTHRIPAEIIPGITAASAAASALKRPLTERGETDRVTFATGQCRPGDPAPNWAEMASEGSTLVLYMAVSKVDQVQANLLNAGIPAQCEVEIVASATKNDQRIARCTLAGLARTVRDQKIANPAVLVIRHSKQIAAQQSTPLALVRP